MPLCKRVAKIRPPSKMISAAVLRCWYRSPSWFVDLRVVSTNYRQISQSLEGARSVLRLFQSFWNLAGAGYIEMPGSSMWLRELAVLNVLIKIIYYGSNQIDRTCVWFGTSVVGSQFLLLSSWNIEMPQRGKVTILSKCRRTVKTIPNVLHTQ